ncbi:MAG: hypothetical protein IJA32_04875 [Lachnospiraceae bacterium]|nr:hypothetical protein [Lachnospiraceae bacterium]
MIQNILVSQLSIIILDSSAFINTRYAGKITLTLASFYIIISTSLVIVEFIYSFKEITPDFVLIFTMLSIILCSPFLAHFLVKTFKILSFKRKKKKILTHGKMYTAKLVDSKKGASLFKDSVTGVEKFSYYPVVEYYDNNDYVRLTSPFAVNNTYLQALRSQQVTIHIYENAFILSDFSVAASKDETLESRTTKYTSLSETFEKVHRKYIIYLVCYLIIINLLRLLLKTLF